LFEFNAAKMPRKDAQVGDLMWRLWTQRPALRGVPIRVFKFAAMNLMQEESFSAGENRQSGEGALGRQHGIVFFLRERVRRVEMIEEGRFVSDDQIFSGSGGALRHIERGHHRDGDAGDLRAGVAGLESVDRADHPRNSHMGLDSRDNLIRGQALVQRARRAVEQNDESE
jgi:hypothetical protein